MEEIAKLLDVPISNFFAEVRNGAKVVPQPFELLRTAYSLRLAESFARIKDRRIQKLTVELMELIADGLNETKR